MTIDMVWSDVEAGIRRRRADVEAVMITQEGTITITADGVVPVTGFTIRGTADDLHRIVVDRIVRAARVVMGAPEDDLGGSADDRAERRLDERARRRGSDGHWASSS